MSKIISENSEFEKFAISAMERIAETVGVPANMLVGDIDEKEISFFNEFQDMSSLCVTGGLFPEGLDWERVGSEDFIIGWIDAPDSIAAGYCSRSFDFLGLRMVSEYVSREERKYL